jgi:threonine dehydratase
MPANEILQSAGPVERRTIAAELIEDARKHVYQAAFRTPLVPLNYAEAPCTIYLKLENLQPIACQVI